MHKVFLAIRSSKINCNKITYSYFIAKIMQIFKFWFRKLNLRHKFHINVQKEKIAFFWSCSVYTILKGILWWKMKFCHMNTFHKKILTSSCLLCKYLVMLQKTTFSFFKTGRHYSFAYCCFDRELEVRSSPLKVPWHHKY